MTGVPGSLLDACAAGQDDQVGQGDFLAAGLRDVEIQLDLLELRKHLLECGRIVDFPVLLGSEADARSIGAAAFVGAAVG